MEVKITFFLFNLLSFNLSKSDKTDMSAFPIQGLYTKSSLAEDL